jgi:hypothetical protein
LVQLVEFPRVCGASLFTIFDLSPISSLGHGRRASVWAGFARNYTGSMTVTDANTSSGDGASKSSGALSFPLRMPSLRFFAAASGQQALPRVTCFANNDSLSAMNFVDES